MKPLVEDLQQCINFWGLGFLTAFPLGSREAERATLLLSFLRREVSGIVDAYLTPRALEGRIVSPLSTLTKDDLLSLKEILEAQVEDMDWDWERTAHISRVLDAVVAELDRRGDAARD